MKATTLTLIIKAAVALVAVVMLIAFWENALRPVFIPDRPAVIPDSGFHVTEHKPVVKPSMLTEPVVADADLVIHAAASPGPATLTVRENLTPRPVTEADPLIGIQYSFEYRENGFIVEGWAGDFLPGQSPYLNIETLTFTDSLRLAIGQEYWAARLKSGGTADGRAAAVRTPWYRHLGASVMLGVMQDREPLVGAGLRWKSWTAGALWTNGQPGVWLQKTFTL